MKKFRFATIFILSFIMLAPLAASATQCCYSPGMSVPSPYGGSTTPPLCDLKNGGCPVDKTEIDCGAQPVCAKLLPICCIFTFTNDPSKGNLCTENPDQHYDCATIQPTGTVFSSVISKCSDLAQCTGPNDHSFMTPTPPAAATTTPSEYPIIVPKLSIDIPTISMPDFAKVTQSNGYIYIPFISVYLVGAYKMGIGIAAILAVIMIMAGGIIWIAAAGDAGRIGQAKTMISGAVVGLVLTVGSYVALQTVNPNLVNFSALKIKTVSRDVEDITQDQDSDITDDSQLPANIQKPNWTAQSFICPPDSTTQPPTGVASPGSLISLDDCPNGISSSGMKATKALHDALCNAGAAAAADGYTIRVSSAYRDFTSQATLWCGSCATNHPDVNQRKTFCAVPGFSNHGQGNAVDVALDDKYGKDLYTPGNSSGQCYVDPATVALIAKYMEGAGFVRYQNEIWHFEVGTQGQALRGNFTALPPKCGK